MKRMLALIAAAALVIPCCTACSQEKPEVPLSTGIGNVPLETTAPAESSETDSSVPEGLPTEQQPAESAPAVLTGADDVEVRPADWKNVQWTVHQDYYFTIKIPEGWQVSSKGNAEQLAWSVSCQDGSIGVFNLDHDYAAKDPEIGAMTGFSISLNEGTVQEYFESLYQNTTDYYTVKNSCVPGDKDYLQSMRPSTPIHDYQSLYAVFSENGKEGEGIYSAVVMTSPDVMTAGHNYGAWEINCVFTEWAPLGQLVNWQPVLREILQSFTYTDAYWNERSQSPSRESISISDDDPVMEAFEERNRSDTIIQEKTSDMIGEYERVYDTETGDIYRAYNGFLDDLGPDQNRFTTITDDQYTEGYVGWIDKD